MPNSTARETFIDTSGCYALLAKKDNRHAATVAFMQQAAAKRQPLVTTDYVLDETATLRVALGAALAGVRPRTAVINTADVFRHAICYADAPV